MLTQQLKNTQLFFVLGGKIYEPCCIQLYFIFPFLQSEVVYRFNAVLLDMMFTQF